MPRSEAARVEGGGHPRRMAVIMDRIVINGILAFLIVTSVVWDLRFRRIPNGLTVPVALVALIVSFLFEGLTGLRISATGLLAGFFLMLFPYMFAGIGGGDVKLLAAVGALKGAAFAFDTFLFAAIAGGAIAIVVALVRGRLRQSFKNIKHILLGLVMRTGMQAPVAEESAASVFPYAGAIAIGVLAAELLMPLLPV